MKKRRKVNLTGVRFNLHTKITNKFTSIPIRSISDSALLNLHSKLLVKLNEQLCIKFDDQINRRIGITGEW